MSTSQHVIVASPEFFESAASLPKDARARILKTLSLLVNDFRHPGLHSKRVQGAAGHVYECRVDDAIRLIYDVNGGSIRCWHVGRHDEALRTAVTTAPSQTLDVDDVELESALAATLHSAHPVIGYLATGEVTTVFRSVPLQDLWANGS